jgi:predicted ATPase
MAVRYGIGKKAKTKQKQNPGTALLHSIALRNFLSYGGSGEEIALAPLNVVIGPNGSGKSNLIEAIDLLRATKADLSARISRGGGSREWLWKGGDETAFASIQAFVEYPDEELSYFLALRMVAEGTEVALERIEYMPSARLVYGEQGDIPAFLDARRRGHQRGELGPRKSNLRQSILSQLREPKQHPEITYLGDSFSKFAVFKLQDLSIEATLRRSQPADLPKDFLLEDGSNLALVLNDFQHRRAPLNDVKERLRRFNPFIEDITLNVYAGAVQIFIHERGFSTPVPAARLSDGTLRYLCLLALLCHPDPPPLLCIEEPELGLHPDVLPSVADLLIAASERTQLIVTTHSDTLVSALSETPESVLVCERLKSGTHLKRLDPARLKEWLEDYSLGDLWRMGEIGGD